MNISGQAVLLRVFVGESDKLGHLPLYEVIVKKARDADLAGATVLKGVMGFGATARIRTQKILDLSSDLPLVIEIVDEEEKVAGFQTVLANFKDHVGVSNPVGWVQIHHAPRNRPRSPSSPNRQTAPVPVRRGRPIPWALPWLRPWPSSCLQRRPYP